MSLCLINQSSLAHQPLPAHGPEVFHAGPPASTAIPAAVPRRKTFSPPPAPDIPRLSTDTTQDAGSIPAQVGQPLARVLQARYRTYRDQIKLCRQGCGTESVHELRVATRRLIAQLVLLECIAPRSATGKASRLLKRRLKSLSQLRDTHVQRIFIEEHIDRFPELILVRDYLKRRERRLEKEVDRRARKFKNGKLGQWIAAVCAALLLHPEDEEGQRRLAATVLQATSQAYQAARQRLAAVDPTDLETVHQTRVAFKKFRYMVESLAPVLVQINPRQLRALALYQRRMGNIQDLAVMQACLAAFIARHRGTQSLLADFNAFLQQKCTRALRQFVRSADELLGFWPPVAPLPETVEATAGPT